MQIEECQVNGVVKQEPQHNSEEVEQNLGLVNEEAEECELEDLIEIERDTKLRA